MMIFRKFVATLVTMAFTVSATSAPPGFPPSGNGLWYVQPGTEWTTQFLPVGNGYLAAMVSGGTSQEIIQLNIESLWTGGPFANFSYNGGNKLVSQQVALAQDMQVIRDTIFQSPNGTIPDVLALQEDPGAYGSYSGAGYLLSSMNITGEASHYSRWLDLDSSIARTRWVQGELTFLRETFCSHPIQACVEHINATAAGMSVALPPVTYAWSMLNQTELPAPSISCLDSSTLRVSGLVAEPGMLYELLLRAQAQGEGAVITCSPETENNNATLNVEGATESWITWVGGTDYSMAAGDEMHNFSFRGPDPHDQLLSLLSTATSKSKSYASVLVEHVTDYTAILSPFSISLGQTPDLSIPTDQLRTAYQTDVGNTYLEWLLFNFGRYLLASSSRGILPANLQGKWADGTANSWGADYHANINLQMNYWFAESTNMDVTQSLFNYIEQTWVPRGSLTAQILYNISEGWVTHDEIFGHTGMKAEAGNPLSAQWANYPESAVWMMIHAWDHFDYTNDVEWWRAQGWPLIKGVAQFHANKLIPDGHFNDSTLVVNPCNSPEQIPITLGCAHAQQLIWQLFCAVEKGYNASGDTDTAFLNEIRTKRSQMDKGIHIGRWGQLQEWKVDMDKPNDTHRHLSHLVGLYPGYAITSYNATLQGGQNILFNGSTKDYDTEQVLAAAEVSLIHRGNGTGPDGDAGWEKVWRAACWAQLGDAEMFYHELTYAIERNFASNLFSLYNPPNEPNPIFQIDANLGYPAAVLNALFQAPDVPDLSLPLYIKLLPALPSAWSNGQIKGARVRGGISLDLEWNNGRAVVATFTVDEGARTRYRMVKVVYEGKVVSQFSTSGGSQNVIRF